MEKPYKELKLQRATKMGKDLKPSEKRKQVCELGPLLRKVMKTRLWEKKVG